MGHPLSTALRPNALLSGFAVQYSQQKGDLARVPGIVPVTKRSDLYRIWDRGDRFRVEMGKRAPGAKSAKADQRVSTTPYFCDRWSLARPLPREKISDYGSLQEAEREIVGYLSEQAFLRRALQFATRFMAAGVWTTNTAQTGVAAGPIANQFLQWNDAASTPIRDIRAQRNVVRRSCGEWPTDFICDSDVFMHLCNHPTIVALITGLGSPQNPSVVMMQTLAAILMVERVTVIDAARNTAAEGAAVAMADVVATNCAVLGFFTDQKEAQGAGKIFSWPEFGGFPADVPVIKRWFDDDTDSWMYEAEQYFTAEITSNPSAVFFATATA